MQLESEGGRPHGRGGPRSTGRRGRPGDSEPRRRGVSVLVVSGGSCPGEVQRRPAPGRRRRQRDGVSRHTTETRVQIVSDASATGGLQVDPALRDFVADELLAGLDLEPTRFWSTLAELNERFAGRVGQLLRRRDELQQQIDDWHREHGAGDVEALEAFLTDIGYLLPLEDPTVRVTG